MMLDDRRLVDRFLRTRSSADFDRLYDAHSGAVYRFALRLCGGDSPGAQEIAQEAWVRSIAALAGFRWGSSLRSWLCGIALNCWRESARARRAPDLHALPDPRVAVDDDAALDLERAIFALAPGYREVLLLHDLEGLTHEEIAAALGIEVGTSKSQLARARRALRERLGQRWRSEG